MNAKETAIATARLYHETPITATIKATVSVENSVATTQLYVRAAGFSIVPNAKMEMVPHAPDMNGVFKPNIVFTVISIRPNTETVTKQHSAPQKMSLVGRFCTSPFPFRSGSDMRLYGSSARLKRERWGG
jgi:hypothetical protein